MKGALFLEKRIAICTAVMIVMASAALFLFSRYDAGTASKPIAQPSNALETGMNNALKVEFKEAKQPEESVVSAKPSIDESDLVYADALSAFARRDNPGILLTAAESPIEEIDGDPALDSTLPGDSLIEPNAVGEPDQISSGLPQDAANKNPQTSDTFTFRQIAVIAVSIVYLALIMVYFYLKKRASD
jgi:hypothetical protein